MTRMLYRRDSKFMRCVSMLVALSFTLSLAGSGFAAPTALESNAPVAEAPQSTESTLAVPAQGSATEEVAQPAPAPEQSSGEVSTPKLVSKKSGKSLTVAPGAPSATGGVSAAAVTAQAGSGDISIVDFQGYHLGQSKWTNGNLGKEYTEGDWVPYRLVLKNTGTAPVAVSDIGIGLDHFDSNPNAAVMFDRTRQWGYALTSTAPTSGDGSGAPAGFTGITPASQDVPEGAAWGAAPTIRTDISAGTFSIQPNQYAVVYFQGHLALTVYWNFIQPGTDGSGGYPGSSGHGYLQMASGARTLPLPSVLTPGGSIKVVKFYDADQDGQKDAGETQFLSGWTMHLHGTDGFTIDISKQTDSNGEALYTPLPPGNYTVHEDLQPGWATKTSQPISVAVVDGEVNTVYIGNYRPDVTKTWSLSIDNLPAGATPYVTYDVNGAARTTNLTGSGPYTASIKVPYGAAITNIKWYVSYGGQDILLGTSADETLTADKTNSFDYDSSVSGAKFSDANGDGIWGMTEVGLPGWTIKLKRVVGATETNYATTVTGADGAYSFVDVLPGTYKVYEVQQGGWFMTAAPAGSFTVADGVTRSGLNFGNLSVASSIDIVKTGTVRAHVGDTITYDFTVTNTGNNTLTDVVVTDPSLWITGHSVGTLTPGQSVTFSATRPAPADPDPLPNTAVVSGADILGALVTDSDSHSVDIIKPAITVTKAADHEKIVLGEDVLYTYVVTNSGEDTLTGVTLSDDKLTLSGGSIGTLAPGASVTRTALVALPVTTTNVATAVGTDILGLQVQDTATENVEVYDPSISIVKSADPTVVLEGELVTYTYLVTNTGDITLSNIAVTDDKLGPVGVIGSLAPGAFTTLTMTAPINADVTNIGTATGYYGAAGTDFFGSVTDSSSEDVDVVHPAIGVVKTASRTAVLPGESVTYTYVVTNNGDVSLFNVELNDDKLGLVGSLASLGVGASQSFTKTVALTASTTNVVVATGADAVGHPVMDDDSATVEVFDPSIQIVKTASKSPILAGETVTYTYVVTNNGDIELTDIDVTDDKLGAIGTIASLAPGASQTLTKSAVITVDTTNVATAVGEYGNVESDFHGTVEDTDDAVVDVVAPSVRVVKTASPSAIVSGNSVTYTFVVTNTGDVPLINLSVDDDKLGHIGDIASLGVGASATLTKATTLTVTTTNIVTVTGTDENDNPVSDTDDETVPVYNPSIQVVKTASKSPILAGETVTYTYVVTNNGDIELKNVGVTDDKLGGIGTIASLAPGASQTLTKSAAITADTTNVATAVGEYGNVESDFHGTVEDTDDAVVDVIAPSVQVVKTATPGAVLSGGSVTYYFEVTNTGDVPLINLSVDDDKLGHIADIASLAPGASTTLSKTTTLSETTTNIATVTGTDEQGNPVSDTDDAIVCVYSPAIQVVKTVEPGTVLSGAGVTYTYAVTNIGDIALHNVSVIDDKLGPIGVVSNLAVGATAYFTVAANISADVTNVATATGFYGNPDSDFFGSVEDTDDAFVDVIHPSITVEKSASASPVLSGDTVTYSYVVTNNGDVPLVDVSVDDNKLGHVGDVAALAVGESVTLTKATALTATTTNVATASATDELGNPVSDTDDATVEVFSPSISLVKTADPTVILAGETVTYTYVVENTGDIWLHDVEVTDNKLGAIGTVDSLDPGEVATLTASAALSTDTLNVGTAVGVYGMIESQFGGTVSDTDDASVNVVNPAIDVVKSASPDAIISGEQVVYTYTVTNIGDVDLFGVELTDDKLGVVGTLQSLAVGASSTFTKATNLSEPTTNTVVAVGTDEFGHEVSDEAQAFVDVALPFTPPDVTIDKSADKTTAKAGDTVRYTLTYRNLGPGVAQDMTIVDDFDERYVTITDAAGGTVADGKITWKDAGPLYPEDGPKTITYTVKINSDLPADVRVVRNTVVISEPTEENRDNNSDSWQVNIGDDPFLPFTGGAWTLLALAAMAAGALGIMLRRLARVTATS